MIKFIHQNNIDRSKWDQCVDEAFNGLVYAKSWYLDIVADQWDALVENDYEKIFPLVSRKKWGIRYLYQPPFTQQLGLFSKTLLSEESVIEFLNAIPEYYKFAEINLNTFNKLTVPEFESENWLTHELDLINSYEHLHRHYSTNLRRNLKKSASGELSLSKNIKPEDVIRLFRENRGKTLTNLDDKDYQRLSRLTYSGIYKGVVSTYGVYEQNNTLCAAAIFLQSQKKMVFLFSGLNDTGRQSGAMAYLIDAFIQEHQHKHLTLDFEGSNDPNLARFYKGFGSTEITYPHLRINRLKPIPRLMLKIAKRFKG
jgi:hypothetical protein